LRGGVDINKKIRFATSNEGKFEEVREILERRGFEIERFDVGYPEIQSFELEEVANFGIEYLWEKFGGDLFLEDSGIFIDSLNGFPGVFSAYAFKTIGNEGILRLLAGKSDREAYFKSVICFCDENGNSNLFSGVVGGRISEEEHGKYGFGFDPIFLYGEETFAEMSLEDKNKISHRRRALNDFVDWLEGR